MQYLEEYVEKRIGGDKDVVDLESIVDMELSYEENKRIVGEYLDERFGDDELLVYNGQAEEIAEQYRERFGCSIELGKDVYMEEPIGKCIYIVGKRNSGKSYMEGYLIEQFIESRIKVLVLDREGDFRFIRGKDVVHVKPNNEDVVSMLYSDRSVIVDVSEMSKKELKDYVGGISKQLLSVGLKEKKPVYLFLDEAEEYAGQYDVVGSFIDLIRRGRKRGIGVGFVGHRISQLNKSILSECDYSVFKRTTLDIDLKRITDYIKQLKGLDKKKEKELSEELHSLDVKKALLVNSECSSVGVIDCLKRKFKHGGRTPTFNGRKVNKEVKPISVMNNVEGINMNDKTINRIGGLKDLKGLKDKKWRTFNLDVMNLLEVMILVVMLGVLFYNVLWWSAVGGFVFALLLMAVGRGIRHKIIKDYNKGGGKNNEKDNS